MITTRDLAAKYIAALDKLKPSTLQPILGRRAVSTDWAYGSNPFHGAAALKTNWAGAFAVSGDTHWRGTLRSDGFGWAAVTWRWRGSTNPLTHKPFEMNGLSILNIKNAKIVRETYYWEVPGRNPGIASVIGGTFATALSTHRSGWQRTVRSLYSKDALKSYAGFGPSALLMWGWAGTSTYLIPLHASLCCAGPSYRLDNGEMRKSWAVVNWIAKLYPSGNKVSGVSVLEFKNAKIFRETMYY